MTDEERAETLAGIAAYNERQRIANQAIADRFWKQEAAAPRDEWYADSARRYLEKREAR